jgi:hypothetical protein
MFVPMCDEALLGVEVGHHPNMVAIRFIKVNFGNAVWS